MCYPTVREYSRHYRDFSPINDDQSDLDIRDGPSLFPRRNLSLPQTLMPYSFCSMILAISEVWSSVSSYLVQSCYRYCHLPVPVIFHPPDLVICCNIGLISPSGPRVSFCHAEEQILLLMYMPQHTPLETQETPFQSPYYRVMVGAIKDSSGSSD
jgi:hypothetical protein